MKKRIWLIILCFLLCIIGLYRPYNESYSLNLPTLSDTFSMALDGHILQDNMDSIYNVLGGKTTNMESVQDSPVHADTYKTIEIKTNNGESYTLFLYEYKNKYYIEQPYNGIYKITKEEYELLSKTKKQ